MRVSRSVTILNCVRSSIQIHITHIAQRSALAAEILQGAVQMLNAYPLFIKTDWESVMGWLAHGIHTEPGHLKPPGCEQEFERGTCLPDLQRAAPSCHKAVRFVSRLEKTFSKETHGEPQNSGSESSNSQTRSTGIYWHTTSNYLKLKPQRASCFGHWKQDKSKLQPFGPARSSMNASRAGFVRLQSTSHGPNVASKQCSHVQNVKQCQLGV